MEKRNVMRCDHGTQLDKNDPLVILTIPSEHLQNQQQSPTDLSEPCSVLYNCEQGRISTSLEHGTFMSGSTTRETHNESSIHSSPVAQSSRYESVIYVQFLRYGSEVSFLR
ncbi:hypothetical protein K443DRAFT_547589 [Laccaria amethystina LaAM-08-1]|uniref:Uncharacterized protein n=1 Tax=Laccaria amethystina LaAM-08-1 TaxID=1095629 RepID=A0A0C9Y136_9AGAR|nr:hypothetical protein K443DRAFT_547589 [Laccaria amethystina LaAM-08-1]